MGNCQNENVQQTVVKPTIFKGLKITCKSWVKTYNNLYDFTSKDQNILTNILQINKSIKLHKDDTKYKIIDINNNIKSQDLTIDIIQGQNGIYLFKPHGQNLKKIQSGLLVEVYLIKSDVIRVGKQKVRVKEIILKDKQQEKQDTPIIAQYKIYNQLTKDSKNDNHLSSENSICRVCLEQGQINNPLIAPCKCMGTAKYIHLSCIQQWLTKTINPHNVNMSIIITWKPLVCQLCSAPLPFKIYLDGKKYFTVKIPKPKKPYLVLNPIYKNQDSSKIYHLVSFFNKNKLIMGRKKDCDIKISDDASVSRMHTVLTYQEIGQKKGFSIQDNQSKYGTLIMLKKNLPLKFNLSGIQLQIGGDLIKFQYGGVFKNQKNIIEDVGQLNQSDESSDLEEEISDQQPAQNQEHRSEDQNQNNHRNNIHNNNSSVAIVE